MAASLTGTLGTPLGRETPGGHITVAMIRRPSLSRAGDAPAAARGRRCRPLPRSHERDTADAGPHQGQPTAPYRDGRAGCRANTSLSQGPLASRQEKGPAMHRNARMTYGLPGQVAVSAAFAANAWAAVPPSRGSPAGRYLAGSGLLAAPLAAGAGEHATAGVAEGWPS